MPGREAYLCGHAEFQLDCPTCVRMRLTGLDPDRCSHEVLDPLCPVCQCFMDGPSETWGQFEAR